MAATSQVSSISSLVTDVRTSLQGHQSDTASGTVNAAAAAGAAAMPAFATAASSYAKVDKNRSDTIPGSRTV